MKIGCVTTTINIPITLALLAKQSQSVEFFIAADKKTTPEAEDWCYENLQPKSRVQYMTPNQQKDLRYKSSELTGWQTDSRRNIAVLEALRAKCDLLISWDDDMLVNAGFIDEFQKFFVPGETTFSGLQLGSYKRWVDVGEYTIPQARQRGIPPDAIPNHEPRFVTDAKIGAAQGIILGTPDAAATHTIANHPHVHSATDILKNGFVVHPEAWAVMNSQLTAFRAELAPTFAQFYFAQGRNTDIQASMLMRRIMRERNLYSYYGPPMALHARSPRLLFNDLKAEMYGMGIIGEYADYLDRAPVPTDASVVEQCRILAKGWNGPELEAALAFYDDCESVL